MREPVNPLIFICIALFASTSWIAPNSMWVEQGIHTLVLPEGYALAATLTVIVQISAIFPAFYVFLENCTSIRLPKPKIILISLIVLILSFVPITYFSENSVSIFGKERSIFVYISAFIFGAIAIGSDVVFIPYMKFLPGNYFQAYFFGVGLASFIPSVLSMIQNASTYECVFNNRTRTLEPQFSNLRFGVTAFYNIIAAWCAVSCVAFYILHWHRDKLSSLFKRSSTPRTDLDTPLGKTDGLDGAVLHAVDDEAGLSKRRDKDRYNLSDRWSLFMIGVLGLQLNSFVPSIQSYVSLPYGSTTYFWSLVLGSLTGPFTATVTFLFPVKRVSFLTLLAALSTIATGFCVLLSFQSPRPWFSSSNYGGIFSVALTMTVYVAGGYARNVLFEAFAEAAPSEAQRDGRLLMAGFVGQVGAFFGVLFLIIAVHILELFEGAPVC